MSTEYAVSENRTPLRVSLVQGDTRWHDPDANREYYGGLIDGLRGITDLVVLPETFTSGFSNDAIDRAETMEGPTVRWMRDRAAALDAAVTGSVQLRTEHGVSNRLLFATPDGALQHYDKRHLFRYAGEHERYAAGRDRLTLDWRGWRIWAWRFMPARCSCRGSCSWMFCRKNCAGRAGIWAGCVPPWRRRA